MRGAGTRVLVTGAAGFVGQWVAEAMVRRGWAVTGAGPDATFDAPRLAADVRSAVAWVPCDVRSTRCAPTRSCTSPGSPP